MLKGLYFHGGKKFTKYGVEVIDSPELYDKLRDWIIKPIHPFPVFIRGNSYDCYSSDKSWLFVEFGNCTDEDNALDRAMHIAEALKTTLLFYGE